MRKTEILRIKKEDILFQDRKLIVHSAKNSKDRLIDIDLKLTIILFLYCIKNNISERDLLFKVKSNSVSVMFYVTMKKSKLRKITFHDLRHIHASYILSKSKRANTIKALQKRLRAC